MGCLTAPFKLLGCLVLLALLAIGWLYRDRIWDEAREHVPTLSELLGRDDEPARTVDLSGRPSQAALQSAQNKVDSLNGWGADSVVLTPSEVASLLRAEMEPYVRGQLDSVEVTLWEGVIEVRGSLATARLPHEMVGPFGFALREREPVSVAGPLEVVGDGRGEWTIRRVSIRDFPLPRDVVPSLVARALGDSARRTVPVPIPVGVSAIRIRPGEAVLYGARAS